MSEERGGLRAAVAIGPGVLLAGVAGGIVFPILPIVGAQAGLALPFIGVILAANRAMRVISSPIVGMLADRFGGRRMLLAGLVIQCAVMISYILGVTTGHPGAFFLAGRMLHGPGSAGVFVAGQALALHAGGAAYGGRSAGTVRAAMVLGVPVGLTLGGLLADRFGNATAFAAALGGILGALVLASWLVPDIRVPVPKRAPLREIVAGFSDRRLVAIGALNFAVTFSASGMVLTTLSLVVRVRGVTLFDLGDRGSAGLLMGVMVITEAMSMPLFGRFGDRTRRHAIIAAAGLIGLVPALMLVALASSTAGLVVGLGLMGIAAGALGPSLLAIVGAIIPSERRGMAVGVLQVCGDLGGTAGPLVGTALFAGSFRAPYVATAVFLACFVPVALRLVRWEQAR